MNAISTAGPAGHPVVAKVALPHVLHLETVFRFSDVAPGKMAVQRVFDFAFEGQRGRFLFPLSQAVLHAAHFSKLEIVEEDNLSRLRTR